MRGYTHFFITCMGMIMLHAQAHTYLFAPGFGNSKNMNDAIDQCALFTEALDILAINDSKATIHRNSGHTHDAIAWIQSPQRSVAVPLYADYDDRIEERFLCQEKDIADMFRAHLLASKAYDTPITCVGHSRGAGSIVVYLRLLNYDLPYLISLAQRYWPAPAYHMLETYTQQQLRKFLYAHTQGVLLIAPFDNLEDTIINASKRQLPFFTSVNKIIGKYAVRPFRKKLCSRLAGISYDWNSIYTPCNLVSHIAPTVPIVCVHGDRDTLVPHAASLEICHTRQRIVPHAYTHYHIIPTRSHVNIYRHLSPEMIESLHA